MLIFIRKETMLLLKIILFTVAINQTLAVDYCDSKICPFQGRHIRCNNDGSFSAACLGNFTLRDMKPHKKRILKEHHIYRNILAGGKLKCFYPAVRMPILKWDNNLAKNAEYNVKTCEFAHDKCRSTLDFPYAGQNIYSLNTNKLYVDIKRFIEEAIFLWFEEYLYANYSIMQSFETTTPQTGHFTLLMNERNTHIGCALLDNFLPGKSIRRFILFTCNYSSGNIKKLPSYIAGKAASRCAKTHHLYKSLCTHANIDTNDIFWYHNN